MRSLVFGARLIGYALVALLFETAIAAAPDYDLTREAGDIKGRITVCGAPAADVLIYAPGTSFDGVTNSAGDFKLSYVQQGTYDLIVKKDRVPLGAVTQVTVAKKQTNNIGTHDFCNDADGDGYTPPQDCDDTNPAINPGTPEECGDAIDNNCNGTADEDCTVCTDNDGDTYFAQGGCGTLIDCDDFDSSISPQATEVCDGVDNNCDGNVDESGANQTYYYVDSDGDGFGNPSTAVLACTAPTGYVSQGGDCNDGDASINPAASEVCDDLDNDCDGTPDEDAIDATAYYFDADDDGFGNTFTEIVACEQPVGYVTSWDDCDDSNPNVYPGNTETCDGIDNNCNGAIDQGEVPVSFMCGAAPPNAAMDCLGPQGCVWGCEGNVADCDGIEANGCEVYILTDANHCGACFNICPTGDQDQAICVGGVCEFP